MNKHKNAPAVASNQGANQNTLQGNSTPEKAQAGFREQPDDDGPTISIECSPLVKSGIYQLGFIGGGVRGLQHFTEMVGGDVCITMNWLGHVDKLLELDQPVVSRLFNPVQEHVLDELLAKVPPCGQAYMED